MAQVIRSTGGFYEVQEVEFGRVYKWHPESAVVECACGERPSLTSSVTACQACGANHAVVIREWLGAVRQLEEDKIHPWRYADTGHSEEEVGLPF